VPLIVGLVPAVDGRGLWCSLTLGFAAARGTRLVLIALSVAAVSALLLSMSVGAIGSVFGLAFMDLSLTSAYLAYAPRSSGWPSARA